MLLLWLLLAGTSAQQPPALTNTITEADKDLQASLRRKKIAAHCEKSKTKCDIDKNGNVIFEQKYTL